MGNREEFLSCGRWAVRGSLILEQSAIPSPGVPSLLSEYASTPERGCSTGREFFFFLLFLILSLIQFVEQIRKRWYLCLDISPSVNMKCMFLNMKMGSRKSNISRGFGDLCMFCMHKSLLVSCLHFLLQTALK